MVSPLDTYRVLLDRLDDFAGRILRRYPDLLRCGPGCDDCCQRDLSLYPFEVDRLLVAASALPREILRSVVERATRPETGDDQRPCPLLAGGRCLVYQARPVICRTHGFPLLVPGEPEISICPHNFQGVLQVDGACVLDLTPVNQVLAVINDLAARESGRRVERVGVAAAIGSHFGGRDGT